MTTAPTLEAIVRSASHLRVPMTHVVRDPEYLEVLDYRIGQEITASEQRLAALRNLRANVERFVASLDDGTAKVFDESCTCDVEDVGDAENGPKLSMTPDENCFVHGRAAMPEEWARADAEERGWIVTGVRSILLGREFDSTFASDDLIVSLYETAVARYDSNDDGYDGDRALGDAADALVSLDAALTGRRVG